MAAPDTEASLEYILLVLSQSEFKADYHAIAETATISSANNAQKKFKKIVEQSGQYKLKKGKVVPVKTEETAEAGAAK